MRKKATMPNKLLLEGIAIDSEDDYDSDDKIDFEEYYLSWFFIYINLQELNQTLIASH